MSAGGGAPAAAWRQTLDAYERRLAAQAALLDAVDGDRAAGVAAPAEWQPPDGLGPLPSDLRPRAHALMAAADALLARSRATAERLRPHAARAPRVVPAVTTAHRLDLSA